MKVFDCHCDTAMSMLMDGQKLDHNRLQISLDRASRLGGYAQFFGHFTSFADHKDPDHKGPPELEAMMKDMTSYKMFHNMYDNLLLEVERCRDRAAICRTGAEGDAAIAAGKTAVFLSIEGAEAVSCDPGLLDEAWEMGVRMVSLTWNFQNALAGTNTTGGGLTAQGREFVRRAQKLGMLVDTSHISEEAFWDICDITDGPVIASHSNAKAICGHSRNLTDEQFRELCQTGGFTGMNLYTSFLDEEAPVTLDTVRRHIDHFLDLGGEKHIALGGDLDGCETLPEGFTGVDDYAKLYDTLLGAGISQTTADGIFFNNVMEVVKKVCVM